MKEALFKKRLGIPAALLILLVLASVATAFSVQSFTCTTTTQEPLSFTKKDGLSITYQGESDDIMVEASNAASVVYGILVDVDVVSGHIESISYSSDNRFTTEEDYGTYNNDDDTLDAKYNIEAFGTHNIVVTVNSADDLSPGELKVNFDFSRKTKYT